MKWTNKVGPKLLGVNLLSLLVALVGLLLLMQYLATRLILEWHRQRVELVGRLVLAEYQGRLQEVIQAGSLLADNPAYGQLLAAGDIPALKTQITPSAQGHRPPGPHHHRQYRGHPGPLSRLRGHRGQHRRQPPGALRP